MSYPDGIIAGVSDADSEAHSSIDYPDVRQHLAKLLVSGECLEHIGAPAEVAAPALIGYLEADQRRDSGALRHDAISWDQHGQRLAAAALSRIRPPDPKTPTLTPPQDQAY